MKYFSMRVFDGKLNIFLIRTIHIYGSCKMNIAELGPSC